jgi:small-conductance mechanosensitive channel
VTLLVGLVVAPLLVRRTAGALRKRAPAGRTTAAVDRLGEYVPTTISGLLLRTLQLGVVLVSAVTLLTVWGLVGVAIDTLTLVGLSIPLLAQVVTTLALLIAGALTVWGVDLSGLLVGAGFLGIVVGLAARQTLGSLIAGFVLMFSRPFTIGDWVEIGEKEGIVTDITIVNTRLENFDGETIVIPNDSVSNRPIVNRSERGHLRIRQDVGIDYASDPDHAADVALDAMTDLKPVADSPPPQVIPKSFGDSAVVLELRFWIERPMPPRKWRAIDAVVRAIKDAFEAEDIKIPFPQQELSGRAETGGFRVRQGAPEAETVKPTTERPAEAPRGPRSNGGESNDDGDGGAEKR